jgi:hypothetical protein
MGAGEAADLIGEGIEDTKPPLNLIPLRKQKDN